jgi:5-methylcytosine-specific restriction endonuclease McrA
VSIAADGTFSRGVTLEGDVVSGRPTGAPQGTCRLCAAPILASDGTVNRRRRWHQLCSDYYTLVTHLEYALGVFRRLDGRLRCYACGYTRHEGSCRVGEHRRFELDHIVPLRDGGSHGLDNMQPLCVPCHREKTAREAKERAYRRRLGVTEEIRRESGFRRSSVSADQRDSTTRFSRPTTI